MLYVSFRLPARTITAILHMLLVSDSPTVMNTCYPQEAMTLGKSNTLSYLINSKIIPFVVCLCGKLSETRLYFNQTRTLFRITTVTKKKLTDLGINLNAIIYFQFFNYVELIHLVFVLNELSQFRSA